MVTELLKLKEPALYRKNIEKAAQTLHSGRIVAFPTETVYGIGVDANDTTAIDYLYRVKQRPKNKEFAVMIAESNDVEKYVKEISPIARKLMKSFWPGPLTMVFVIPHNETIGFRNSSNHVVKDLIKTANVAIASTSANIAGRPPAMDAQQVLNYFDDKIDVILDGPTGSRTPSTVVKIIDDTFEIVRHGVIKEERINRCLNENCLGIRP